MKVKCFQPPGVSGARGPRAQWGIRIQGLPVRESAEWWWGDRADPHWLGSFFTQGAQKGDLIPSELRFSL